MIEVKFSGTLAEIALDVKLLSKAFDNLISPDDNKEVVPAPLEPTLYVTPIPGVTFEEPKQRKQNRAGGECRYCQKAFGSPQGLGRHEHYCLSKSKS